MTGCTQLRSRAESLLVERIGNAGSRKLDLAEGSDIIPFVYGLASHTPSCFWLR